MIREKIKEKGNSMILKKDDSGFIFRSGFSKSRPMSKSYSSFWDTTVDDNVLDDFLGLSIDKPKGKDVIALAGYKRAISNFVSIVTEKNIPVVFNNKDESFTDGKKVVIGADLNDKKFDVAVGLALHEASHIKLSNFSLLKNLEFEIPAETYLLGLDKGITKSETLKLVKNILNYIEDRRIDNFIFSTSPGYKGYYHSMYEKYFYSKNVDNGLLSSEFRVEDIESYMFRIINLHNKNCQLGALSGLKEIYSFIDLKNISRLTTTADVLKVALDVVGVIFKSIDKSEILNDEDGNSSDESTEGMEGTDDNASGGSSSEGVNENDDSSDNGGSNTISDEDLKEALDNDSIGNGTSNDDGSEPIELSDRQKELLKKHFKKQEKFLDGDVKKTKLSKKDNDSISAIDESGATYEKVGKGCPTSNYYYNHNNISNGINCLVVKKLTKSLIDSNIFSCATTYNHDRYFGYNSYNFIEEGLRLGSILGKKLKIRGEENSLKYSRKDSGRIDKRLLAECGFNNSNVFSQTFVEKFNKAYLHISIDASGSMSGKKWNRAMTSAVAMIKACDMAGNIDVIVSIRTTHIPYRGTVNVPLIMVIYDSSVDKLAKVKSMFPSINTTGTTPEGLCFESIMKDLISGNSNQDSYFINYSDGQPIYSNKDIYYAGECAETHTRKMVKEMKNRGLKVMSYFITDDDYSSSNLEKSFKTMYGKDASLINPTNMMEVAKTMNKKFLEK